MEQMYKTSSESMRQLLEIAICCGRCWQSPQTGFIHYCYTIKDEKAHQTIPTYENFLFTLALLRSRTAENISDAKDLLQRLLHFQVKEGEMAGNFPVYIHEYPHCKDRLAGAHSLIPIYWIYKNFHHVLGAELKQALKMSLLRLQGYCLNTIEKKLAPYPITLKVACCARGVGTLLNQVQFSHSGDRLFSGLKQHLDKAAWYSPSYLSDVLIAYQIIHSSFSNELDKSFWDSLVATWHGPTCSYCGPGWKEYQNGKQPQVTFYDYFMGYLNGTYSFRCFADHPVQLQAALVHPMEERLPEYSYPLNYEGMLHGLPWQVAQHKEVAISAIAKETSAIPVQEKNFIPLKILWGTPRLTHSFVCQGGTSQGIDFKMNGKEIELFFSFSGPAEVHDSDKNQEVSFFVDDTETKITIEGTAATTFKLGEEVLIKSEDVQIALKLDLHIGQGNFIGHIMKSNRPSQQALTGPSRFTVYDRQIFLRTVQRSEECVVKATIRIL